MVSLVAYVKDEGASGVLKTRKSERMNTTIATA